MRAPHYPPGNNERDYGKAEQEGGAGADEVRLNRVERHSLRAGISSDCPAEVQIRCDVHRERREDQPSQCDRNSVSERLLCEPIHLHDGLRFVSLPNAAFCCKGSKYISCERRSAERSVVAQRISIPLTAATL